MRDRGWPWAALAALFGIGFFLWSYGLAALDGTYVGWLASGDRAQTFLGWHFYRREGLSFPLGAIPSLAYPVGSSLAYSDAIPWFAVLLAPLSPLLPETYQIAGLWLLVAYALQGAFAFLILNRLQGDRVIALAGSVLVVASPPLARRGGHLSLCAHWLLLAAFAAFLATRKERSVRRFLPYWLPLLVVAGGTHPYLTAMVLVLALAACANGTPLARLRLRAEGGTVDDRAWPRTVRRARSPSSPPRASRSTSSATSRRRRSPLAASASSRPTCSPSWIPTAARACCPTSTAWRATRATASSAPAPSSCSASVSPPACVGGARRDRPRPGCASIAPSCACSPCPKQLHKSGP